LRGREIRLRNFVAVVFDCACVPHSFSRETVIRKPEGVREFHLQSNHRIRTPASSLPGHDTGGQGMREAGPRRLASAHKDLAPVASIREIFGIDSRICKARDATFSTSAARVATSRGSRRAIDGVGSRVTSGTGLLSSGMFN